MGSGRPLPSWFRKVGAAGVASITLAALLTLIVGLYVVSAILFVGAALFAEEVIRLRRRFANRNAKPS